MEQQLRRRVTWLAIAVGVLLALLLLVATLPRGGRSEPSLAVAPPTAAEAEVDSAAPATGPTAGGFSLGLGDAVSLAWRLGLVALVLGGVQPIHLSDEAHVVGCRPDDVDPVTRLQEVDGAPAAERQRIGDAEQPRLAGRRRKPPPPPAERNDGAAEDESN